MDKKYLLLIVVFISQFGFGQLVSPSFYHSEIIPLVGTGQIVASATAQLDAGKVYGTYQLSEKTVAAKLFIKLDLGEDYVESQAGTLPFEVKLTVKYTLNGVDEQKDLIINEFQPEQLIRVDFLTEANSVTNLSPVTLSIIGTPEISTGGTNPNPLDPNSFISKYIDASLRLSAYIERDYVIDVRDHSTQLMSPPLSALGVTLTGKRAKFNWGYSNQQFESDYLYPNYELQILRLQDNSDATNGGILTTVDWSKALKIETQSYKKEFELALMEGTGYYVWRVRPIGTYYKGSIANSENYGLWSTNLSNGESIQLNQGIASSDNKFFYFEDPDQDINWIYSRAFAEGDGDENGVKTSENITFADPLLRVRQSQSYNGEDQTSIVNQTISDFSGRGALSTLPVPVQVGASLEYIPSFVKNEAGQLYTALDFDDDANVSNPSKIDDNSAGFSYYDGINANGVGNTEGYSFSRTVFKTDGTSRVTEASGIGADFALGTQHTNRTIYSSPSDEELLRVFGLEAPLAESVLKTTNIDPNGVVTTAYTSKEGKTIATAMVSNETTNLLALGNGAENNSLIINNSTGQSVLQNNIFRSTKRLALWEDKELSMSYRLDQGGNGCATCNFVVKFYLFDLTNNVQYVSDQDGSLVDGITPFILDGHLDAQNNYKFTDAPNWKWVKLTNIPVISSFIISGVDNNKFTLPSGEYLMVKEVFSQNPIEEVNNNLQADHDGVEEIINKIQEKMQTVNNEQENEAFLVWMQDLSVLFEADLSNVTSQNAIISFLEITDPNFVFPVNFSLEYSTNSANDPNAGELTISNSGDCASCQSQTISIPKPEVCLICEATLANGNTIDGINFIRENVSNQAELNVDGTAWTAIYNLVLNGLNSGMPEDNSFMGYLRMNEAYVAEGGTPAFINKIAPGFTEDRLAFMITNMLTSKYYTGNSLFTSNGNRYAAKEDSNGELQYLLASNNELTTTDVALAQLVNALDVPFNYDCKDLLNCWMQAVDMISLVNFDESVNVMDEFNDRTEGDSSEDEYDNEDNKEDAEDKGAFQGLMDFIVSQKMRKFNNSDEGTVTPEKANSFASLTNLFMQCSGYQFDMIIDDDVISNNAIPSEYDSRNYSCTGPNTIANSTLPSNLGSEYYVLADDFAPILLNCNSGNCTGQTFYELYYPYMVKPEWMFKYYTYNSFNTFNSSGQIPDLTTPFLVNQWEVEVSSCYNDLFASYSGNNLPSCQKSCNYYHENWSSGQRLNFYQQIKGAKKFPRSCDEPTETIDVDPLECEDAQSLINLMNTEITNAKSYCEERKGEFKSKIIDELINSCYTIVECVTGSSPENEVGQANIDDMAQAVVDACIQKIETIEMKINTQTSMYWASTGVITNNLNETDDPGEYPYCEIIGCVNFNVRDIYQNPYIEVSKKNVILFPDCDQITLDQANSWVFDVNIPAPSNISNCPSEIDKEWEDNLTEDPLCNDNDITISGAHATITNVIPGN